MKLTIERSALLKTLGHVQSVVERRNTIPILSNLLMRAEGDSLAVTATDMDLTIVETTPAQVATAGAVTAPAHTLYDIVRKLPDGSDIRLEGGAEGGQLTVAAGRSRFSLQSLPSDDFPEIGEDEGGVRFQLSAADLRKIVDRTRFAISTEETRYYLNGIYLHAAKTDAGAAVLRAVATDGHRLAKVELPAPDGATDIPGVIVPRKAVGELRKLIEDADDPVDIALSESRVRFGLGEATLTTKLIDGAFPDYERVIPSGNDKVLEVDCADFAKAVDRVATIATEKSRAVKLAIGGGKLTLSANSPDAGSAEEQIEVSYDAEPLEIGFNARYLLDIAQQIEGQGARFIMADAAAPTVVRDAADPDALYVLMPMRV